MPLARRIYFDAQYDSQFILPDHASRIGGAIGDSHPIGMASNQFFDSFELDFYRSFVIVRFFCMMPAKLMGEEFIIDDVGDHQAQPTLVGPFDPVNIHLLVDYSGKFRPAIKIWKTAYWMTRIEPSQETGAISRLSKDCQKVASPWNGHERVGAMSEFLRVRCRCSHQQLDAQIGDVPSASDKKTEPGIASIDDKFL